MFKLFTKGIASAFFALVSLIAMESSLMAWGEYCEPAPWECCAAPVECCGAPVECCNTSRTYIGAFGGGIYSNNTRMSQMGTAFFLEAEGGPLSVYAQGRSKKYSSGFGGVQIGYEASRSFGNSGATLLTAGEFEAYFFSQKKRGHLINSNDTNRLPEHDFLVSFKTDMSVLLVNAVFAIDTPCLRGFTPYVGGGIGAAHFCLKHADSLQTDPPEVGINHFNSKRSDSTWAFAAQAKAGLRYKIGESLHIFGEYRYLYVDASNYILGSTVYDGHAVTSPWNVKVHNIQNNAFAFGIQFDL